MNGPEGRLAIDLLHYVNAAAALLLATVAGLRARRGGRPARWGGAAFAALAVALLIRAVDDEVRPEWTVKLLVCFLLAFPYLLLRFTESFAAVPAIIARVAPGWLAAMLAATVALPYFPEDGASRPAWFVIYVLAGAAFWTALASATIVALWRGGAGQPRLMRRRARLMSIATGGMNVLILLLGAGLSEGTVELVLHALLFTSLAAFAVGFAPPAFVRLAWRLPEQEALQRATEELVAATTVSEVTDTLLPHVARIAGGSGAALWDEDGAAVASFGSVPPAHDGSRSDAVRLETVPLSPPFGSLVVATSPLTPFFGREELGLLHGLGALVDISLERCVLGEREREIQAALRLASEEAERANMAKSDFLSRMSHELRTPLNVVLGFGQILEMRDTLRDDDREAVEQILKAGRHLLDLINEVLDLSRIESGRMAVSPEPVELADLAGEAVDLVRPLAQQRSVQVVAELGECHCHVIADRQRLKQVLLNLLSNAIKYNREGGDVEISCARREGGRLRLRVRDTGPGIPTALMGKLFQPFERLEAAGGREEGTGLGLALSRQLVELMGGEIGVESGEGQGSVFWIELDLAQPGQDDGAGGAPAGREQDRPAPPPGPRRLLLVEDNLANLKVIQRLLSERPHIELLPAMTGSLGLELAREHRPHLILLDQHLPDVTGAEVLRRLKAEPATQAIPVVVVSADASPGQIRRMLELGASEYLTKPLDVRRFMRLVDDIIDREAPAP